MSLDPEITYVLRPEITLTATTEEGAQNAGRRLLEQIFQSDDVLAVESGAPEALTP